MISTLATAASLTTAALLALSSNGLSPQGASPILIAQESPTETVPSTAPRFSCQLVDGEYTVMYNPESQPESAYAWAAPGDMGGGWAADRRCTEISRRLEEYRPDGLLELRTDVENGYNTVCATTEAGGGCRIVFTVPQGQDPLQTRDRVFENLAIANQGQDTSAVNTYTGNGGSILQQIGQELGINLPTGQGSRTGSGRSTTAIDLRPFLDPADGGTGRALRAEGRRLDPDIFR